MDYIPYMDELAETIGCHPHPWRYLFTDPKLAYRLFFKANVSYVYRLRGPMPWAGARRAIMEVEKRIESGLKA